MSYIPIISYFEKEELPKTNKIDLKLIKNKEYKDNIKPKGKKGSNKNGI
jgi:hypothetical protein